MKIVLIGAGSASFGRGQIADVLLSDELRGRNVTLMLVDEDEQRLEKMMRVAVRMREHTHSDVALEDTTDRRKGLLGAKYAIVAVARKRMELWEQDYRIPFSYGFNHVLGENGGPGALFHTLRSLNLVIPICRDIEEICPDALVLNFTNPEARVLHAVSHLTKVKAIGLCHGVFSSLEKVSKYLQRPIEELDVVSAGINHFYVFLQVRDRKTGEDLLPRAIELAASDRDEKSQPLFRKFAEIFDLFTFCSDDHIGEYLACGATFCDGKWPYGLERLKVPMREESLPDILQEYADGKRPANDPPILQPSNELAVPIICDIELDRKAFRPAVNVLNEEGYIENLPRTAAVEVPACVDAGGVHPVHVGPLPENFATFIRPQLMIHELVTEAHRTRSKKLLLQALLLDPVVNNITAAERMLDEMLELQSEFLPAFS